MASVCCDSFSIVKSLLISLVFLLWISQGSSKPHRNSPDFSNSFGDDTVSLSRFLAVYNLKINKLSLKFLNDLFINILFFFIKDFIV